MWHMAEVKLKHTLKDIWKIFLNKYTTLIFKFKRSSSRAISFTFQILKQQGQNYKNKFYKPRSNLNIKKHSEERGSTRWVFQ